jgi:hypothetical protein
MITSETTDQTGSTELRGNALPVLRKWKARLHDILASIPGTRQFHRRIKKLVIKDARESLEKFISLQALDENTKQNLQRRIRRYENRLAVVEVGFLQRSLSMLWVAIVSVWLILAVLGPYLTISWFKLRPSALDVVNSSVWGFVLSMFLMGVPLWIFKRIDEFLSENTQPAFFFLWMAVPVIVFGVVLQVFVSSHIVLPIRIYDFLMITLMTAFAFMCVLPVLFALFVIVAFAWTRYVSCCYPDYIITDRLIRIISLIETSPQRWGELDFKKELVFRLESIAGRLVRDLPKQLRCEDPVTDAWLAELTIRSAAAMRGLKKWVITPKPDTRDQLLISLTRSLELAASGNWDGLEQLQPEVYPGAQRPWFYRLASLVGRLLSAFSVLILSWILPYTPIALDQPLAGYLTLVGLGVAVFGITTMLDPSWVDKLNALKDFLGLLPFTGRNK